MVPERSCNAGHGHRLSASKNPHLAPSTQGLVMRSRRLSRWGWSAFPTSARGASPPLLQALVGCVGGLKGAQNLGAPKIHRPPQGWDGHRPPQGWDGRHITTGACRLGSTGLEIERAIGKQGRSAKTCQPCFPRHALLARRVFPLSPPPPPFLSPPPPPPFSWQLSASIECCGDRQRDRETRTTAWTRGSFSPP